MAHNSDVIVHTVNFDLHVGIGFNQGLIRVLASFKFAPQIHNLVFLSPDLCFEILQLRNKLQVCCRLRLRPPMQISVLLLVPLLECLQVRKFIHEALELVFEILHLPFAVVELSLRLLDLVRLFVDGSVELLRPIERLCSLELEGSDLALQLFALLRRLLALVVEPFDFLEVLIVTVADQNQLLLTLVFLREQALVRLLALH